jgi:hypothetical protein
MAWFHLCFSSLPAREKHSLFYVPAMAKLSAGAMMSR